MPAARTWCCALAIAVTLAACASSPGQPEEASDARKAAETNTRLGQQYMARGQYEVALEKLRRAVAYDRTYAPAHTLLGVLHETLGQSEEAGKEYRLAAQYDPDDGDVNNNYAVYLCGQKKYEEAGKHFETAIRDPFYATPEVAYANAGLCALDQGELDKAETYLRQSLELDAEFPTALLLMANLSFRKQEFLSARAFLQRFEAVADDSAESLLLAYRIEQSLGDAAAADRYRAALLNTFPNSAEAARVREGN